MVAKAVVFTNPLPKVYNILPPPLEDLDEVLAVVFTGPVKPTTDELKRTPFLVRRNAVGNALRWLQANHPDYSDLEMSEENLATYPQCDVPVTIEYQTRTANTSSEETAIHDLAVEEGTETGSCPFAVHGMMGTAVSSLSRDALKRTALEHLESGGKVLAVGHSDEMVSIFKNPRLYPMMFPWLFPYGSAGLGTAKLNDENHLKHLLIYQDKRFQTDDHFVLVAFHHLQVKNAALASFLVTERTGFPIMADRLLSVDLDVLRALVARLERGPVSANNLSLAEKSCLDLLKDLDVIGSHVDGFVTSKRFMRTEIWSLITHLGSPSWYITLSPADIHHPLCIYWAGTDDAFIPDFSKHEEAIARVIANPVAAARFFHFMVQLFIKHGLGFHSNHPGLFGETEAYYGTVEQQGRLTLHLHLLLWIKSSLSPADVRERLDDEASLFWMELVRYLEECHQGEFCTGSFEEVSNMVRQNKAAGCVPPTFTLPTAPPMGCSKECGECEMCMRLNEWQSRFKLETDELLFRSNVHRCTNNLDTNGQLKANRTHGGCLGKFNTCKARFPRPTFLKTVFDRLTGHVDVKKREPMINTFNYILTYLLRCNTDVTSLLSGTAVKAVVAYVTDYITKSTLKTHVMLGIVLLVLQGNSELINGDGDRREKARKLMTKIVNTMGVKMEIGGPFVSLYLLGLPDHYTSHRFIKINWRSFVRETMRAFRQDTLDDVAEKVLIKKVNGRYVGTSYVDDYKFRPKEYEDMCLYDWARLSRVRRKMSMAEEADLQAEDDSSVDPADVSDESDCDGNTNVTLRSFLPGHPLSKIRGVHCVQNDPLLVACFMGGSLPRKNIGDRDFYCATMLTLFKPWRTGLSLKLPDVSWNTAFGDFAFSASQERLMKNMNTQYECLDARDDYSAQLKLNNTSLSFSHWQEAQEAALEGDQHRTIDHLCDYEDDERLAPIGDRAKLQNDHMKEMRHRLDSAGWSSDRNPDFVHYPPEPVTADALLRPAREWSNILTKYKEEAKNAPSAVRYDEPMDVEDDGSNLITGDTEFIPNTVKIVNKAYLDRNFRPSKRVNELQNKIVDELHLNPAQERAFRIASNHVASNVKEQLRMFITGMAGTGKTTVLRSLKQFFELRWESHRFAIIAPTGSAAALVGGSTYHSVLNVGDFQGNEYSATAVSKSQQRKIATTPERSRLCVSG